MEADGFRLDTNGLAANGGASCRFSRGVLRAQTNYNDTVVEMRLLTAGGERLTHVAGSCDTENRRHNGCFHGDFAAGDFRARFWRQRGAPFDGGLHAEIAPSLEFDNFSNPPIVVAANATMNTPVLTISANQSRVLFLSRVDRRCRFRSRWPQRQCDDKHQKTGDGQCSIATGRGSTIIVNAMGLGDTKDLTVVFVSAPRVISSADGFIGLNAARAFAGATILEDGNSGLTILHSDNDNEFYTINSAGSIFGRLIGRAAW